MVGKGVLEFRYAEMAVIGHRCEAALPITMVCPFLKGSVLETFSRIDMYFGEYYGISACPLLSDDIWVEIPC